MSFTNLRRVAIHYEDTAVQNMISAIKTAPFPSQAPIDPATPRSLGIDYDYLRDLRRKFTDEWRWEQLEKKVNAYNHFLVDYISPEGDNLQFHFVHQRSKRPDAIPLLLLHGWPGTFHDFHKVIDPLVNPSDPEHPAFHVVVPSIPGYFLSTLPRRDGWNLEDTARLYNDLMVNLLRYKTYAAQGGDWGAIIVRVIANQYPESLLAVHFNLFLAPASLHEDTSQLSAGERKQLEQRAWFDSVGRGYSEIQTTKPFTIGIAIGSSPLAILAYIGEKFYDYSDPVRVDPLDIIDTAALYFLSGSFVTSVLIYNQAWKDPAGREIVANPTTLEVKSKAFGLSIFPYDIGGVFQPEAEKFGNLTFYRVHENGGHFPALDNPDDFVTDLRDFFAENYP